MLRLEVLVLFSAPENSQITERFDMPDKCPNAPDIAAGLHTEEFYSGTGLRCVACGFRKPRHMHIFEQEAGVISDDVCWVCICEEYMYIAPTLLELVELLNTEWEHDKHIVG